MTADRTARDRRRSERFEVNLPSHVTWQDSRVPCRMVDVSASGALLETKLKAALGEKVAVDLPSGESVLGRIVRITGSHIALSFPGMLLVAPLLAEAARAVPN